MSLVPPHVEALFVIEVRGTVVKRIALDVALSLMAEAMKASGGNPESARKAILLEFQRLVAVV